MLTRSVTLAGSPRAIGEAHAAALHESIHDCMHRWLVHLGAQQPEEPIDLLRAFLQETSHVETARRLTPALAEEVDAISRAGGVDADVVWSWVHMDELWTYLSRHDSVSEQARTACSGVAVRASADGHPVVAQNMDLEAFEDWDPLMLRLRPEDGPAVLVLADPGGIGLCGCNAAGVAVTVSTLSQLPSSTDGLGVSFIVRTLLAERDLDSVRRVVSALPHASGQNYLVGTPDGIADFECSADGVREFGSGDDTIIHTNHPLVSGTTDTGSESVDRLALLRAVVPAGASRLQVQQALSDRTVPVCKDGEGSRTYASLVMELDTPPRVWVAPGPPTPDAYEVVEF